MPRDPQRKPANKAPAAHAGRTVAALVVLLLLAACAVTAVGCGETTSTPAAAQHTTTAPPSSTAASAGGTQGAPAGATSTSSSTQARGGSPARHGKRDGRAHGRRAHLVLPPPGSHLAAKLTVAQRAKVSVADIALTSPAVTQARSASVSTLARQYTCRGADYSPPLHWTGVPPGTKELALFAISTQPVAGKLFFDWALAHLNPDLKGLDTNKLPAGAVAGRNGHGQTAYSICPTGANHENYVFVLYALPQSLSPTPGFDPATLRQQATQLARHTGLLLASYG